MKITVYSTKGQQKYAHETQATTWGALKQELSGVFDFNSLNATENITKRDLTVDAAELPTTDFILFLRPKTTKSGAYSYKEAKAIIKYDRAAQKVIKEAYATDYTHLSTEQLNEAIARFVQKTGQSAAMTPQTPDCCNQTEDEASEEEKDVIKVLNKALKASGYSNFSVAIFINRDEDAAPMPEKVRAKTVAEMEAEELQKLQAEADTIFG